MMKMMNISFAEFSQHDKACETRELSIGFR